tara:strand:- start:761 stop:886 length:126 start_codon:yes stop_codon:yes gene_type:complete
MKKGLTKLYDKEKKVYIERWLSKKQFENLPFRYCLPCEVEK